MRTAASPLSSFFANRLRAGLWIAAVCGATALIVAVLIGFGQSKPKAATETRRAVVARYIIRVGRIQIGMAKQVRAIDAGYKKFASSPQSLQQRVPAYRKAQQTLTDLRDELRLALPPARRRSCTGCCSDSRIRTSRWPAW